MYSLSLFSICVVSFRKSTGFSYALPRTLLTYVCKYADKELGGYICKIVNCGFLWRRALELLFCVLLPCCLLSFKTTKKYLGKLVKFLKEENKVSAPCVVSSKKYLLFLSDSQRSFSSPGAWQEMKVFHLEPNLSSPGRTKERKTIKRGLKFLLEPEVLNDLKSKYGGGSGNKGHSQSKDALREGVLCGEGRPGQGSGGRGFGSTSSNTKPLTLPAGIAACLLASVSYLIK